MRLCPAILWVVAAMFLASCGAAPLAQIGSTSLPAVQIGGTSQPVAVINASMPAVTTNVNLPPVTAAVVVLAVAVILAAALGVAGLWLHAGRTDKLATRRLARREMPQ